MTRSRMHPALVAAGTIGAVGAGAAIWGIGIERYLFTVRHAAAVALPAGSRPLRVLHISDAHMAPWQHRKQRWLASLAELEPDLIVNTGDNLGHPDGLAGIRRSFDVFAGVPGVFVHGSNDVHAPAPRNPFKYFMGPSRHRSSAPMLDTEAMDSYFEHSLGWVGLNNTAGRVEAGGLTLDLFGVDDAHRGWDELEELPDALAGLGDASRAAARFGVTHAPYQRVLNSFVELGAAAIFAGHTHGGQVRLPGYGALVANCDIPLGQSRGLSWWHRGGEHVPLNVSAGCGHSIYAPVRFACRPEATLLTLLPRS